MHIGGECAGSWAEQWQKSDVCKLYGPYHLQILFVQLPYLPPKSVLPTVQYYNFLVDCGKILFTSGFEKLQFICGPVGTGFEADRPETPTLIFNYYVQM